MSRKKKKPVSVQEKKRDDNVIGVISSAEMLKKSQPIANIPFKTGPNGSGKYVRKRKNKSRMRNWKEDY